MAWNSVKGRTSRAVALGILCCLVGAGLLATSIGPADTTFRGSVPDAAARTSAGYTRDSSPSAALDGRAIGAGEKPSETGALGAIKAQFDAALAQHPEEPAPLRQLAAELLLLNPTAGLDAYKKLVSQYPRDAMSWTELAGANLNQGEPEAARRAVAQALKVNPRSAQAHVTRGEVLVALNPAATSQALREWKLAIQLEPDTETARKAARLIALYEGR